VIIDGLNICSQLINSGNFSAAKLAATTPDVL
jgi:hypothetical protein